MPKKQAIARTSSPGYWMAEPMSSGDMWWMILPCTMHRRCWWRGRQHVAGVTEIEIFHLRAPCAAHFLPNLRLIINLPGTVGTSVNMVTDQWIGPAWPCQLSQGPHGVLEDRCGQGCHRLTTWMLQEYYRTVKSVPDGFLRGGTENFQLTFGMPFHYPDSNKSLCGSFRKK